MGEGFGDADFGGAEEAMRIVVELAALDENKMPSEIGQLISKARDWRRRHVSVVE